MFLLLIIIIATVIILAVRKTPEQKQLKRDIDRISRENSTTLKRYLKETYGEDSIK